MTVEYQYLRPRQMTARRDAVPVAYMGLGILEWHGLHNPLGLSGDHAAAVETSLMLAQYALTAKVFFEENEV